jgi:hypothetical protein
MMSQVQSMTQLTMNTPISNPIGTHRCPDSTQDCTGLAGISTRSSGTNPRRTLLSAAALLVAFTLTATAQVPQIINYQGKIAVGSTPFTGTGQFRFSLVDGTGATSFWSNDGTSTAGSEPTAAVSLPVVNGLYIVPLGDATLTNMTAIPATVFANADVRVRVWFNDGSTGSQLLAPDQRITSVGYAMVAGTVPDGAITTAKLGNSLLPQLQSSTTAPFAASAGNVGTVYFNSADKRLYFSDGTNWLPTGNSQAAYRWAVWSTYDQAITWFYSNTTSLTGGVNPSTWTDNRGTAAMISADKKIQATLFNKKASISPNSVVWSEAWSSSSSTNGKLAGALFRVRNKTGAAIDWTLNFYGTCYDAWSEVASVSLNGAASYSSGTTNGNATTTHTVMLSVPASRTSTVICVASSGAPGSNMRSTVLAFYNNCLTLPSGLEFVDDLETATGGYEQ